MPLPQSAQHPDKLEQFTLSEHYTRVTPWGETKIPKDVLDCEMYPIVCTLQKLHQHGGVAIKAAKQRKGRQTKEEQEKATTIKHVQAENLKALENYEVGHNDHNRPQRP